MPRECHRNYDTSPSFSNVAALFALTLINLSDSNPHVSIKEVGAKLNSPWTDWLTGSNPTYKHLLRKAEQSVLLYKSICNYLTPMFSRLYPALQERLEDELARKVEKFQKRLSETDPVSGAPRYGESMTAKVRTRCQLRIKRGAPPIVVRSWRPIQNCLKFYPLPCVSLQALINYHLNPFRREEGIVKFSPPLRLYSVQVVAKSHFSVYPFALHVGTVCYIS